MDSLEADFRPIAQSRAPTRVAVLSSGRNPTFDYYLRRRLSASGLAWRAFDPGTDAERLGRYLRHADRGTYLVVCRYVEGPSLRSIEAARAWLSGVALFDDDDIAAQIADSALPNGYRERLWLQRGRFEQSLGALASCRWVSTPTLAARHTDRTPVFCLPPLPLDRELQARPSRPATTTQSPLRWIYHATASHTREALWLLPVVAAVQQARPQWHFEIVGDATVADAYRSLPRVSVLPPRSWPAYLAWSRWQRATLGLLPFTDSAVNRARSEVKLFDYARLGAVTLADERWPWRHRLERPDAALWAAGTVSAWIERLLTLSPDDLAAAWHAQKAWRRERHDKASPLPFF